MVILDRQEDAEQPYLTFQAFRENRLSLSVRFTGETLTGDGHPGDTVDRKYTGDRKHTGDMAQTAMAMARVCFSRESRAQLAQGEHTGQQIAVLQVQLPGIGEEPPAPPGDIQLGTCTHLAPF